MSRPITVTEPSWPRPVSRVMRTLVLLLLTASALADGDHNSSLAWLAERAWGEQTGLVLLAYLGAGYTDRGTPRENRYARVVRGGLRELMRRQQRDGRLATFLHTHAIDTLALCEAYWMTRNPRYKKPARDAIRWLTREADLRMRNGLPLAAPTLVWTAVAVKSASFAGLEIDPDSFRRLRAALDRVPQTTPRTTAAVLLGGIMLGEDPRGARMRQAADKLLESDAVDDATALVATLGLFQIGGGHWRAWKRRFVKFEKSQKNNGSWNDDVRATALRTMCLEVYYRN